MMKNFKSVKSLSLFLCSVLIAVTALSATGCNGKKNTDNNIGNVTQNQDVAVEKTVLGEGSRIFDFTVTGPDGKESAFEIHTDKSNVGDALSELGLISGEEGAYGLYVKTVNGVTVDYNKDGKFWAFYENGKAAASGVDKTEITDGAVYSFKAE